MNAEDIRTLKRTAVRIRRLTLDAIADLGVGHLGGSMSVVEVLVYLYHRVLTIDPNDPRNPNRDKFVMSKGHAGPALYSVLADLGYFPVEMLFTLNRGNTRLPSHCDMNRTPGIDMTTGSLGQGLSSAVGMALGHRIQNLPGRVFVLIGDGDTEEGQTWEAAMSASMYRLDNLVAFTDLNKLQIDGPTDDVMRLDRLEDKWTSFGWFVQRVNGHNFRALDSAARKAIAHDEGPAMIILDTVKGKGIPFAEGDYKNHNMPVTREQAEEARRCLAGAEEALR